MNDADQAMRALETLQDIEPDSNHVEVVHEDAVIAVEALVEVLDDSQAPKRSKTSRPLIGGMMTRIGTRSSKSPVRKPMSRLEKGL
ncbi:hypothetical protein KTS45_19015 [Halomicroarcula limicola]|uniref:Uncharacterized protein n=1 Tax=Haloarcula limicola TaxID=1429915 RepID=A0A8J7YGZ9_9EURY|nr:hypothetical protein [Halomicroarcula limicola]MBV0926303.1 hypothetical protein [Halomicroarcula limicola]